MGGDGGSIPSRIDMVRVKGYSSAQSESQGAMGYHSNRYKKTAEESIDLKAVRQHRMQHCALTEAELRTPAVACRAGYLYCKESVLEHLLSGGANNGTFSHITSLKDVVPITPPGVCPITAKDLCDGVTRADLMWPCGCIVSEKVSKLGDAGKHVCVVCEAGVEMVVRLAPDRDELESQLKVAKERRTKKGRKDGEGAEVGKVGKGSMIGSKRLKASAAEHEEGVKQYSGGIGAIFHNDKKEEKKDAFGRSYSSKGVGV